LEGPLLELPSLVRKYYELSTNQPTNINHPTCAESTFTSQQRV
jgi:hypothetical protein